MRSKMCILTAILLLGVATTMAEFAYVGNPIQVGSWGQSFSESGVGNFDLVAVRMVSLGDSFESLAHRGLPTGWSTTYEAGTPPILATAQGPALSNMTWTIYFTGSQSEPLVFDFVAFRGDQLLESARAAWNNGWTITGGPWNPARGEVLSVPPVPAPAAAMLGAIGIGLIGWVKRRLV